MDDTRRSDIWSVIVGNGNIFKEENEKVQNFLLVMVVVW